MIKAIKILLEDYFDSTDLMNAILNNYDKELKKSIKTSDSRRQFLISILGKVTYNKYANNGTFAPVPMSALRISYNDFCSLNKMNTCKDEASYEYTVKLLNELKKIYYRNELKLFNNGISYDLQTNIIFKSLDDITDFFMNIKKVYKKVYKTDENIDWRSFVKKFRNYLK